APAAPTTTCRSRSARSARCSKLRPFTRAAAPGRTCRRWPPATPSRPAGSTRPSTPSASRPQPTARRPGSPWAWPSGSPPRARRLGSAAALLGDPPVLILDEPVNGLDPEGIRWIRNLMKSLAAEGRTVFISSHLISEVAQTAEELIVIGQGRLLAHTTVAELSSTASSLEDAFFRLTESVSDYTGRT